MTLYLIGLGLNESSITLEALEVLKKCKKAYLENYTVDFPYKKQSLEKNLKVKIIELGREEVESESFLEEAKKSNIALLIYGSPLAATTHFSIIETCKKEKIPFKIFHNSSILTTIAESGLQLYKFGKTASLPAWNETYKPDSFVEIIKQNKKIKAHTLLLVDIGLPLEKAKQQLSETLKKHNLKNKRILLLSALGTNKSKITYTNLEKLSNKTLAPFCFVIPGELHFTEEEFLKKI
jgi:diphthine synthase